MTNLTQTEAMKGLSPRVRGNLEGPEKSGANDGSIPACAGEPARPGSSCEGSRVYPRVCGGTYSTRRTPPSAFGLSPRVRGNP